MINKQQALEELKAWCEKFGASISAGEHNSSVYIEDKSSYIMVGKECIDADTIQTELNRMKDDEANN
jgi:hypothetical protein